LKELRLHSFQMKGSRLSSRQWFDLGSDRTEYQRIRTSLLLDLRLSSRPVLHFVQLFCKSKRVKIVLASSSVSNTSVSASLNSITSSNAFLSRWLYLKPSQSSQSRHPGRPPHNNIGATNLSLSFLNEH
jgi:hypothetical protein